MTIMSLIANQRKCQTIFKHAEKDLGNDHCTHEKSEGFLIGLDQARC